MTSLAQEFSLALTEARATEASYAPLLEKFEELKEVLQSNFIEERLVSTWIVSKKKVKTPIFNINLEDKFMFKGCRYLYIDINRARYVMALGEIGELKDRVFIIEDSYFKPSKCKTCVYSTRIGNFRDVNFYLEDKITCVQLFSQFIKNYKPYLVQQ